MRIQKTSLKTPTGAHIVDGYSTSTTDGYSCNYVNKNVGIVDSGTGYIKYADGTMICYGSENYSSIICDTLYTSNLYWTVKSINFPETFINVPTINATIVAPGDLLYENIKSATVSSFECFISSEKNTSISNVSLNFVAIGKWK